MTIMPEHPSAYDAMNFAPYKFFGVSGFGIAYISSQAASHARALLGLALEGSRQTKGLRVSMDVITFGHSAESPYSKRTMEPFDSKGMVRVSPLLVHSPKEIERFLLVTEEITRM